MSECECAFDEDFLLFILLSTLTRLMIRKEDDVSYLITIDRLSSNEEKRKVMNQRCNRANNDELER